MSHIILRPIYMGGAFIAVFACVSSFILQTGGVVLPTHPLNATMLLSVAICGVWVMIIDVVFDWLGV